MNNRHLDVIEGEIKRRLEGYDILVIAMRDVLDYGLRNAMPGIIGMAAAALERVYNGDGGES